MSPPQERGSVFHSCWAQRYPKDGHKSLLKGVRSVRVGTLTAMSPSRCQQIGLCKPGSGPGTESPLIEGLVPMGVYLHWEMCGLRHTHKLRLQHWDWSPPWHRGTGPCPLRADGSEALKDVLQDPPACLQRGHINSPHHLWPNALHSQTSPQRQLPALHEAFLSPKNLFSGKFRPLNQHVLDICYCVKRQLQPEHYLTARKH